MTALLWVVECIVNGEWCAMLERVHASRELAEADRDRLLARDRVSQGYRVTPFHAAYDSQTVR